MKWYDSYDEHWDWKGICFAVFFVVPATICLFIAMSVAVWLLVAVT